jgi:F-type H+-transporting ATPase subunit b
MSLASIVLLAAEEGGHAENAFWLPHDIKEVIYGSLAFFIVAFFITKFGRNAVVGGLRKRTAGIEESLTEAADARSAAEGERDRIKAALADSGTEAARIVEDARQAADSLTAEIATRADRDVAAVRERATIDLAATRHQMEADLSGELSRLALGAAEKVVEGSLDDANQRRLIDDYIAGIGTQN